MTEKILKTLHGFNADRAEAHHQMNSNDPRPNGIACPEPGCGKELMDSHPNRTLTSYPPQKHVHCPACGYTGLRVA